MPCSRATKHESYWPEATSSRAAHSFGQRCCGSAKHRVTEGNMSLSWPTDFCCWLLLLISPVCIAQGPLLMMILFLLDRTNVTPTIYLGWSEIIRPQRSCKRGITILPTCVGQIYPVSRTEAGCHH